ncbi:hypothetical protein BKA70DRAFT_1234316 [Coprinopsis sp. MPI-PUGE-AT-0042]|nr:hypothetical protein BKA70DRAFT_1234316 [Coprinopsis sp. MPI-PUGE-AT-0042]
MPKAPSHSPVAPMLPRRRSPRIRRVKNEVEGSASSGTGLLPGGLKSLVSGLSLNDKFTEQEARGRRQVRESSIDYRQKAKTLEKQLGTLRSTLARAKAKVEAKTEQALDLRAELQQIKKDMEMVERESDHKDELLDAARKDTEQYRNWWLNEIQFMKLLLNKIPEPNKDIDLVRASQAHYLGHY